RPQLKTMAATRTNFIELSSSLAKASGPVMVIAFGHGGRQGSTPVLHVRGPRLTPREFSTLAAQGKQTEASWILMFRGSGAFANELSGEGRKIFSSDCDTSFTSDPIGMGVLLKIIRANPAISFDEMGPKTGKAIAEWYSSRNLARTEEPTLWNQASKPQLLASSGKEEVGPNKESPPEPASRPKVEV